MSEKTIYQRGSTTWPKWTAALALTIGASLAPPQTTRSADITVDGACTLEDAILSANTDTAVGGCIAGTISDIITLAVDVTGTPPVSGAPPVSGTVPTTAAFPTVTSDITIDGSGHTIAGDGVRPVLYNIGDMTLKNAVITGGNNTLNAGGGIINTSTGRLAVENSTIHNNTAYWGGGGISNQGELNLNNSIVINNTASSGGGIESSEKEATITESIITHNTADWGGGGIGAFNSTLRISNSTISDNSCLFGGNGGGISSRDNYDRSTSSLIINNSTISGNSSPGQGGGIFNVSAATITNSTISGNLAGSSGGGISNDNPYNYSSTANTLIANTTITGNSVTGSSSHGGGISVEGESVAVTLERSIVSGNIASTAVGSEIYVAGASIPLTVDAYNLFGHSGLSNGDAFSGFSAPFPNNTSDIFATAGGGLPLPPALPEILNPVLQNNGGSTWTHALMPGSPAIDLAPLDCGTTPPLIIDQRGYVRPVGQGCDAGAYEFVPYNYGFLPAINMLLLLQSSPPTTN